MQITCQRIELTELNELIKREIRNNIREHKVDEVKEILEETCSIKKAWKSDN